MIMRSSLRPVAGVMDCERSIADSRFRPSGVISYTQAKISTASRPMAAAITKTCSTQGGASITPTRKSTACKTTQAISA